MMLLASQERTFERVALDVAFGSQAVAQTISLERLLSSAYQPLAGEFSKVAILNVRFHQ
jgi:hypothetical protein